MLNATDSAPVQVLSAHKALYITRPGKATEKLYRGGFSGTQLYGAKKNGGKNLSVGRPGIGADAPDRLEKMPGRRQRQAK